MKKNILSIVAMLFALSLLAFSAMAQETETIQIGVGNYQSEVTPIYNWGKLYYTGTETLYLKDELGLKQGDIITSLSYYCCSGSASGGNFNVRMKNTNITSFVVGADEYDTSMIEINFDDPVCGNTTLGSYSAGDWITFQLTTPFIYRGENIIIDIRNTAPATRHGWCYFAIDRFNGIDNRRGFTWTEANSENPHVDGFRPNTGQIWVWSQENSQLTERPLIRISYIPTNYNYDVNGDGAITSADITAIYDYMLGTN